MATQWKNNTGSGTGGFTPTAHLWSLEGTQGAISSWQLQNTNNQISQRRQVKFGNDYEDGAILVYKGSNATFDAACNEHEKRASLSSICNPSHGVDISLEA